MKQTLAFLIAMTMLLSCSPNQVTPPTQDFELLPALQSIELNPGGETSLWIKLNRSEGFDETVRMFLESLPAGVSQRWSRDTENGDCTLILSADEFVTPGTYSLDLLGEIQGGTGQQANGLKTQAAGLSLVIGPSISFSAALQPAILTVPANSETGMRLTMRNASTNPLRISIAGAPPGIGLSTEAIQSIQGFKIITLRLAVKSGTLIGTNSLSLVVSQDGTIKTIPLNLEITQEPANPSFKFTLSAVSLKLDKTASAGLSVFITRIKGFDKAITLGLDTSLTQLTGVSAMPVTTNTNSLQSALTIASNNAAPLGQTFQTQVRGSAGNVFKQANLNISINLTPGSLDTSFSDNGIAENAGANRFTLLSNDKMVTVKHEVPFLIVKRHNVNGILDTTFDSDGSISHPDQGMTNNFQNLQGIKSLSDNKLIILGSKNASSGAGDSIIILKLKANGQLDTTFSGDGVFTTEMPDDSNVTSFAIQADGKIVVGGADKNVGGGVTLIRILSDGSQLDTSFGELGVVAINSEFKMSAIEEILLQPDGKILIAGARESGITDDDGTLGRLLPSGLEDSSFAGGFQPIPFNHLNEVFFNVAQDLNQNVLAIGLSGNLPVQGMMVKLKPDAKLDDSFSTDGRLTLDTNFLNVSSTPINTGDLVIQRDNKPVFLIGTELTGFKFLLVRLNTNGTRDTTYAGTGKVTVPSSIGIPVEMALDSQGRMVILGSAGLARIVP